MLTYAQQSKEQANVEQDKLAKRIQEFRTQSEMAQLQASNDVSTSSKAIGMNGLDTNAYKSMEAIMQSCAKGEVSSHMFQQMHYKDPYLPIWTKRFTYYFG